MPLKLNTIKKIVIKIGSSLLTDNEQQLNIAFIEKISKQISICVKSNLQIFIVSSGSVAAGLPYLQKQSRPSDRLSLQVAAGVGQMRLINAYQNAFLRHKLQTAQVLLTAEDMANRTLYLNARSTLRQFAKYAIVPVINENDVIITDEVSFGNNDYLAAQVANLVEADLLILLTDVDGIYKNPADKTDVIKESSANNPALLSYVGAHQTLWGSGGMKSKIDAAQVAARSGAHTVIANGKTANIIQKVLNGKTAIGSLLLADIPRLSARKQWLASGLHVLGKITLDDGAVSAIVDKKKSLLSPGIKSVQGSFMRGDCVKLVSTSGKILGYALINYSTSEAKQLCGVKSKDIKKVLGYVREEEIAHRDNMSILA